jgi:hypothetical protein
MTASSFQSQGLLKDKTVFLSASKPSRRLDTFRTLTEQSVEIEEAVLSLARAVFSEQGRLVFGAHPSISPLIASVAAEYFPPHWDASGGEAPVIIYQSKAFQDVIPMATRRLGELGYVRMVMVENVDGEFFEPERSHEEQCLKSLALMRRHMFQETNPVAMVAAGGMEGVIREALLFLLRPTGNIYTLRTTGGASERLGTFLGNRRLYLIDEPETAAGWEARLHTLEDRFPGWNVPWARGSHRPPAPYALLMQNMVREIAAAGDSHG